MKFERYDNALQTLKEALNRLQKYTEHTIDCNSRVGYYNDAKFSNIKLYDTKIIYMVTWGKCDCGLDELRNEIKDIK